MGLAEVAFKRDQINEAGEILQEALAVQPNDVYVQTSWGRYLYLKKKFPEAEVAFKKAISKYKINSAKRYQLPLMSMDIISKQFYFKRAILQVKMPVSDASELIILNTHFDAFSQGTDTKKKQVDFVHALLTRFSKERQSWIIGGDFNLIPPGKAYSLLKEKQKDYYIENTELEILYNKYQAVPDFYEANSDECNKWFTHFPNHPGVIAPDRTIDYYFLSDEIFLGKHYVRQQDTLEISDHLPVIIEVKI